MGSVSVLLKPIILSCAKAGDELLMAKSSLYRLSCLMYPELSGYTFPVTVAQEARLIRIRQATNA